jgi:hypothetical protein
VESGENERERRLGHARLGRERLRERAKLLALDERGDEWVEG